MQSEYLAYLEKVQTVLQAHSEKLAILANLSSLTHQRERYPYKLRHHVHKKPFASENKGLFIKKGDFK